MLNKKDGFTLMELVVTILVSTLVAVAAATTLLFGLRLNNQSAQTQTQQNTTRILLSVLEDMAAEGAVGHVVNNFGSWEVRGQVPEGDPDAEGQLLLHYKEGAILSPANEVLLDGILASEAAYDNAKNLLTVEVETDTGIFSSTIHCRMGSVKETGDAAKVEELKNKSDADLAAEALQATQVARKELLRVLVEQRNSKGWIAPKDPTNPNYFSKWYITTKEGSEAWGQNGWNENTPWCACFVSWGLYMVNEVLSNHLELPANRTVIAEEQEVPYWFANVDEFMRYFTERNKDPNLETLSWYPMAANPSAPRPNPGDVLFFDRDVYDNEQNPDHVAVVYHVETYGNADPSDDVIFTIEGNSMGKVAIREYSATNPTIIGYGVLPWIPQEAASEGEGT